MMLLFRMGEGIEGADNFIFLISTDSVENFWCRRELEHAFKYNKRIIPIFIDTINKKLIPVEIQGLEYLDLTQQDNLATLIKIIKEEATYYQKHKILLVKAIKWSKQNQNRSLLLRGCNLQQFEAWFNTAKSRDLHPPIPLQSEFLQISKEQSTDEVLDVFISYSRADADFARNLNDRLQELGKTTWFDQESIGVGEEFQKEIEKGIENSDNFVFIISPRSINSPYCADEVEHAFMLNKRFITMLLKPVNTKDLHPDLGKVQWIDFSQGDFWLHFNELVRVLDTDREHVRNHSKWSQRALEWQDKGKSADLLLRGINLETALAWLKETEAKKIQPLATVLQREYINKSRNQRRNNRWLLRGSIGGVIGVLSIGLVVSTSLWREAQRQTTIANLRKSVAEIKLLQGEKPLEALVKVIDAVGINLEKLPKDRFSVFPEIHRELLSAVDVFKQRQIYFHDDMVYSVEFSPDSQYIVSGSNDGTVSLWDINGNLLYTYSHDDEVNLVKFSLDSQYIVSGSRDNTVRLWDTKGNLLQTYSHDDEVYLVEFSPDGQYIVSGSVDNTVRLWDTKGNLLQTYSHDDEVYLVEFSPDGQYIVSGSKDATVRLWDIEGKLIHTYSHDGRVWSVKFSPDGEYIVSGSKDNTVGLWDTKGNLLQTYSHDDYIYSLQFSPNSQYIVSGSLDHTVRLWDTKGNLIHTYYHNDRVYSAKFSADSQYIVNGGVDNTVRLWLAGWESALEVGCRHLRYNPVFEQPETEEAKNAKATCEKYVWD